MTPLTRKQDARFAKRFRKIAKQHKLRGVRHVGGFDFENITKDTKIEDVLNEVCEMLEAANRGEFIKVDSFEELLKFNGK